MSTVHEIASAAIAVCLVIAGPAVVSKYGQTGSGGSDGLPLQSFSAPVATDLFQQPVSTAHLILQQLVSGTPESGSGVVDIRPADDPESPPVGAVTYLSAAQTSDGRVRLEVLPDITSVQARQAIIQKGAPLDQYSSGSFSGGAVLLQVKQNADSAAAYGQMLPLVLLVN
jgi:hypothetical protein